MNKQRKHYSPDQKVAIIKQYLLEKVPVSDLCDKYDLRPAVLYRWQKQFFENSALTFQRQTGAKTTGLEKKVEALE